MTKRHLLIVLLALAAFVFMVSACDQSPTMEKDAGADSAKAAPAPSDPAGVKLTAKTDQAASPCDSCPHKGTAKCADCPHNPANADKGASCDDCPFKGTEKCADCPHKAAGACADCPHKGTAKCDDCPHNPANADKGASCDDCPFKDTEKCADCPHKPKADCGGCPHAKAAQAAKAEAAPEGIQVVGNATCPISGKNVAGDAQSPSFYSDWKGYRIGFMCPVCKGKFDRRDDAGKDEALKKALEIVGKPVPADL